MKQETKQFIKQVLMLSIPVMLQQLLNNLLNMTDTVMIGMISEDAISGVAVANKIFFIYQLILFGLTNGFGIFLSQYSGSKLHDKLADIYTLGIRACLCISAAAMLICLFLQKPILSIFLTNPITIQIASSYLTVLIVSFIPFALTNMIAVAFRSLGKPKYPLIAGTISFFSNVVMNSILIFGLFGFPRLEAAGAAIATVIARFIETLILILLTRRYLDGIHLKRHIELGVEFIRTILAKALPLMGNELMWSLGLNIIFVNYSFVGEAYIPAITVVDNISNLIYVIFSGCSVAVSVMVGQALGSGKSREEVLSDVRKMQILVMVIYLSGGALLILTNQLTPRLFSLSAMNLSMASSLLIVKALLAWTQGYSNTIYYVLRSGGDTKSVLIIDGIFTWVGPVLLSILAARVFHFDIFYTYLIVEGAGLIKVCLATYFLKKEKWIQNLTVHA